MKLSPSFSGSRFSKVIGRSLLAMLVSSASLAIAGEKAPIQLTGHKSPEACLPEFVVPETPSEYRNLLNTPTPPAPTPRNDLSASPSNVVPSSPAQSFDFGGSVQGTALLASAYVPAMVGDALNGGGPVSTSVTRNLTATGTVPIANFLTAFSPTPDPTSGSPWSPTLASPPPAQFTVSGLPSSYSQSISNLQFSTVNPQNVIFSPSTGIDLDLLFPNPVSPSDPGAPDPTYIQQNLSKFQNIAVQDSTQVNNLVQNGISATGLPTDGTLNFLNGNVGINGNGTQGIGIWNYQYDYMSMFIPSDVPAQVASMIPAGGGVGAAPSITTGRQKLAENASPIPRDRVFVNYSYFHNTPLAAGGVDVNRVTPGFEKTFFNGNASFELRTPFASTLDSTVDLNGVTNNTNTEFGNMTMYFKYLFYTDSQWALSTGMGIAVPTADDFVVRGQNAAGQNITLTRIENQSVHLLPFIGGVYTPNDRFFVQGLVQIDVDANGNPVTVSGFDSNDFTGVQRSLGRGYDYTYMYLDINAGYWIFQDHGSGRFVTGLAPIAELHLNQSVGGANSVAGGVDGVNWNFQSGGAVSQLNSLVGMTAILRDTSTLTLAYCTPLTTQRAFDGEFRLNFNWYFGNSRPTNRLMRTPAF
jgi:hypothetical protein